MYNIYIIHIDKLLSNKSEYVTTLDSELIKLLSSKYQNKRKVYKQIQNLMFALAKISRAHIY